MWQALRAELAYSRPWILGGLGLAVGVALMISGIFLAVGDDGPPRHAAAAIRAMFLILAPLVTGFIVQAFRAEERRARLLLAAPLTPRQIATATALLPVVLLVIGVLAAGLVIVAETLVVGGLDFESLHIVGYVGGLLWMMLMMGLLVQEATAAHRQRRRRAAAAGWAGFAIVVLALAALVSAALVVQGPWTWYSLHLGNLIAGLMAMAASVTLYAGRTDFTR